MYAWYISKRLNYRATAKSTKSKYQRLGGSYLVMEQYNDLSSLAKGLALLMVYSGWQRLIQKWMASLFVFTKFVNFNYFDKISHIKNGDIYFYYKK